MLGFLIITTTYFFCFLCFASPVQVLLRRKPKPFSIKYLLIYISVAILGSIIIAIFIYSLESADIFGLFLMSVYNGIVFWLFDSIILRDEQI